MLFIYGAISVIFLCTTYDSCAYILSKTAMRRSDMQPSKILRIVFSVLLVIQPAILKAVVQSIYPPVTLSVSHRFPPTNHLVLIQQFNSHSDLKLLI